MLETFQPLIDAATGIDLTDPETACTQLKERLDPTSDEGQKLSEALVRLLEEGSVADRGEAPVKYSRAAKATKETSGFSIDVVHMSGAGPGA